MSIVNGTQGVINSPTAQIVCEDGYVGIPRTLEYALLSLCVPVCLRFCVSACLPACLAAYLANSADQ